MEYSFDHYTKASKALPKHFKNIVGGLRGEKYYYHDITIPDNNAPKEAVCAVYASTLYASRERGGWEESGYTFYIDVNGKRIERESDRISSRICKVIDAWLEEVR